MKTVNWRDPVPNRPEQTLIGVQSNQESGSRQNSQGFFPSYVVNNSGNWVCAGTGLKDGDVRDRAYRVRRQASRAPLGQPRPAEATSQ